MDEKNYQHSEHEEQRLHLNREELVERIACATYAEGYIEPLPGVHLGRLSAPAEHIHGMLDPSFCVIAQGSKEILLGNSRYRYDPLHYLLSTMDLPSVGQVVVASKEQPYLSLRLELPATLVSSVMVELGQSAAPKKVVDVRAVDVSLLDGDLLDAVVRLVKLLDCPTQAPILMPMLTREIIYRLLLGDQGSRLRHISAGGGYTSIITRAVQRIRQQFDQTLRVEQMASELGMSVSSFHHQFKAVTAMSPLQFQKQIRLQEARRLMLGENLDVANAAFRVGYNDASHFNREYKSVFGAPPMRDVQRLREATSTVEVG